MNKRDHLWGPKGIPAVQHINYMKMVASFVHVLNQGNSSEYWLERVTSVLNECVVKLEMKFNTDK